MIEWHERFRSECYREVDGYFVWWPNGPLNGFHDSDSLRQMADWLDEMNAEWDKIVQSDPAIGGR